MPANLPASRADRLSSQVPPCAATACEIALTSPGRSSPTKVRTSGVVMGILGLGRLSSPLFRLSPCPFKRTAMGRLRFPRRRERFAAGEPHEKKTDDFLTGGRMGLIVFQNISLSGFRSGF